MSTSSSIPRIAAALVLGGLVAASGCSWFRKGDAMYANDPANRPLEVPPPLELPRADANVASAAGAATTATTASGPAMATGSIGFTVPGSRDAVFERVGEVLAGVEGVVVVSRAQLLGAYDVTYQGQSFLVRIAGGENGSTVSAVDPRGVPVTGEAATGLLAQLKAKLGGN